MNYQHDPLTDDELTEIKARNDAWISKGMEAYAAEIGVYQLNRILNELIKLRRMACTLKKKAKP